MCIRDRTSPANIALRVSAYDVENNISQDDRDFLKSLHNHFDNLTLYGVKNQKVSHILQTCGLHFTRTGKYGDDETKSYISSLLNNWSQNEVITTEDWELSTIWNKKFDTNIIQIPFCLIAPRREIIIANPPVSLGDFYRESYRRAHNGAFISLADSKNIKAHGRYSTDLTEKLSELTLNFPSSEGFYLGLSLILDSYNLRNRRKFNNNPEDLLKYLQCLSEKSNCIFLGQLGNLEDIQADQKNLIFARTPQFILAKPNNEEIIDSLLQKELLVTVRKNKSLAPSGLSSCNANLTSRVNLKAVTRSLEDNNFVFSNIKEAGEKNDPVDIFVVDIGFPNAFNKRPKILEKLSLKSGPRDDHTHLLDAHGSAVSLIAAGGLDIIENDDETITKKFRIIQKSINQLPENDEYLVELLKSSNSANQFSVVNLSLEKIKEDWVNAKLTGAQFEKALYVISAGNSGREYSISENKHFSDNFKRNQTIVVGGLSENNKEVDESSVKGDVVNLFAPACVNSLWGEHIDSHWGTSFAAPKFSFVAAVVGAELIRSNQPFSPVDVLDHIMASSEIIPSTDTERRYSRSTKEYYLRLNEGSATNVLMDTVELNDRLEGFSGQFLGIFEYDDDTAEFDYNGEIKSYKEDSKILSSIGRLKGSEAQLVRKADDSHELLKPYVGEIKCKIANGNLQTPSISGLRQINFNQEDGYIGALFSEIDRKELDGDSRVLGDNDHVVGVELIPMCVDWKNSIYSIVAFRTAEQIANGYGVTLIPTRLVDRVNMVSHTFARYFDN